MNSRIVTATTVSDAVKDMLRRQIRAGWTSERIAWAMQQLGHEGWNAHTATSLTRPGTRPLSVDEALGLMAALKSRSSIIAKEAGRLEAILVKKDEASQ